MKIWKSASVVGLVLAVGCGGGGGGGGGGASIGAGILPGSSAPVLSATRAAGGYSTALFYQGNNAIGGAVTALTIAPQSTAVLAGIFPLGQVQLLDGTTGVREGQFTFDVTSFASIGSQVFASTSNAGAPRAASVFVRDNATTPASWMLSLDGTQRESAVVTFGGSAWCFSGEVDRGTATVAVLSSNRWADVASLGSAVPQVATVHSGTIYVGSKAWSSLGGEAKLHRSTTGTKWEEIVVPGTIGAGQTGRVSSIASIGTYLFVGTEITDDRGQTVGGSFSFFDEAQQGLVVLAELVNEAPTAMCSADGTVYVGTNTGRVFWYSGEFSLGFQRIDAATASQSQGTGGLVEETGTMPSNGVMSLTAGDSGKLFIGVRGLKGAQVFVRAPKGGAPTPGPGPAPGTPAVTALSPTTGAVAAAVTITGTGFDLTAANNLVRFGGVPATVTAATATTLAVTVPAGATTGPVTVEVAGLVGTGPTFTVQATTVLKTYLVDVKPLVASCTGCHDQAHPSYKLAGGDMADFNASVAKTATPAETSLLLRKPAVDGVSHGGGSRWPKGGNAYNTVLQWIKDGKRFN